MKLCRLVIWAGFICQLLQKLTLLVPVKITIPCHKYLQCFCLRQNMSIIVTSFSPFCSRLWRGWGHWEFDCVHVLQWSKPAPTCTSHLGSCWSSWRWSPTCCFAWRTRSWATPPPQGRMLSHWSQGRAAPSVARSTRRPFTTSSGRVHLVSFPFVLIIGLLWVLQ